MSNATFCVAGAGAAGKIPQVFPRFQTVSGAVFRSGLSKNPPKSASEKGFCGILRFSTVSTPPTTTTTTLFLLSFLLPSLSQNGKQRLRACRTMALRDWTICFSDGALKIKMKCHTRVPRFRLLAPLRGSTPRQLSDLVFTVTPLCRSAQNDTVG